MGGCVVDGGVYGKRVAVWCLDWLGVDQSVGCWVGVLMWYVVCPVGRGPGGE